MRATLSSYGAGERGALRLPTVRGISLRARIPTVGRGNTHLPQAAPAAIDRPPLVLADLKAHLFRKVLWRRAERRASPTASRAVALHVVDFGFVDVVVFLLCGVRAVPVRAPDGRERRAGLGF